MPLDRGRKLEHLERTHTDGENMKRPHRKTPDSRWIWTLNFLVVRTTGFSTFCSQGRTKHQHTPVFTSTETTLYDII